MKNTNPVSLQQIKDTHMSSRNANIRHKERLSKLDKLAVWITKKVGSMGFFMIVFTWSAVWLTWNTLAPLHLRFDPFPAFVLWLIISNMLQIFLMPLIMVGQNLQSRHSEIRAEEDYLINKKAELEIETILTHLENQDKLILQILSKMEKEEKNKLVP
jgi:uncharacterized membrane protein